MRTVEVIQVPHEMHRRTCDHPGCAYRDEQIVKPGDSLHRRGFERCFLCQADVCRAHTTYFREHQSDDYPDATVCHTCAPRFAEAWMWAEQNAGRHDSLMDIVNARLAQNGTESQ